MKLFVVDPHTIYRRGLAVCLEALPEVESVGQAGSVRTAWEAEALFASDLVMELLDGIASDDKPAGARLTDREQQVLSLIAAGHPTREVALELSYSERTVKNVLHDVVTKLNARSRSQAVAHAVREGLI